MMKISAPLLFIVLLWLLQGCEEEEPVLGFVTGSGQASEADGTQTVSINLGKKVTSDVTLTYMVGGTAALDGDYKILSTTNFFSNSSFSVIVPKGQSTASITFQLIDDAQVEPAEEFCCPLSHSLLLFYGLIDGAQLEPIDESIYFQITGISDSQLSKSLQRLQYQFNVQDNDLPPTNGLQVDLSWNLGDGISINNANFDLYLACNVQLNDHGDITAMELVDEVSGINLKGFETMVANYTLKDQKYYLIIRFAEGTSDATVFLHMSQGEEYGVASGRVTKDYLGKDIYYGPISKNGNTFSFR
jgi:hypothetical protein